MHWAPLSSSLSTYGCIFISPLHITNSASSPESGDFTSHRVHWTWLGLTLWPCWSTPPFLLFTSICLMDCGCMDCGPWLLQTIHTLCHTHCTCCNSVMIPSGYMTSIAPVHPGEGSSSVALLKVSSLFSQWMFFLYLLGVFPDPKWDSGSGMTYVYRL